MVGLCKEGTDTSEKKVTDVVPSAVLGNIAPYVLVPPRASILGAELWSFVPLCLLLFSRCAIFFLLLTFVHVPKVWKALPCISSSSQSPFLPWRRSMQLTDHVI